jgi:hypothetical protein
MQKEVERLYELPYSYYNFEHRMKMLHSIFNNTRNARQMIGWIFGGEPTYPGYHVQHGKEM